MFWVSAKVSKFKWHFWLQSKFQDRTRGLLGVWNDNPDDDLRTRNGDHVDPSESNDVIHTQFGMTWQTRESESIFKYFASADHAYFSNPSFEPNYEVPSGDVGNITGICSFNTNQLFSQIK